VALSLALAAGGWTALAFVGLAAIGVEPAVAAIFLIYVAAFSLLPGIVVTRLLLPRLASPGTFLIYALSAGLTLDVLLFLPLWALGHSNLFRALPLVAAGALLLLSRRLQLKRLLGGCIVGRREIGGALLLWATPLLTMGYLLTQDNSSHFAFQGVIVRSLALGWPPPNLLLADVPLSYNYAAHLWLLAAHESTGLPVETLVARLGPVFFPGCAAAMLFAFGRFILGLPSWAAVLPVVGVFWVVGTPPIATGVFGTFIPLGAALIMSPALAFAVFLFILTLVIESLARRPGGEPWAGLAAGAATFVATGARGAAGPILLCALGLLWAASIRRVAFWGALLHLLAAGAGFAAALVVFFTVGSDFSGTGFVNFVGQPFTTLLAPNQHLFTVPGTLIGLGVPALAAAAVAFVLIAAFQAGFLTPAFFYRFASMVREGPSNAELLLLGAGVAGAVAFSLTEAPGYGHVSFLQYANVSFSLLGALGLVSALQSRIGSGVIGRGGWLRHPLVALTGALLLLHLSEVPASSLRWLGRGAVAGTVALLHPWEGRPPGVEASASCEARESDVNLMVAAWKEAADAVIVEVPDGKVFLGGCEDFWWTVLRPMQTINNYALVYLPGRARGHLRHVLARRAAHLAVAISKAREGVLATDDLVAVAATVQGGHPVFAIVPEGLRHVGSSEVWRLAGNDRLVLLRLRKAQR
jgi:hypothetical protein